jgi:hypothetical protein
MKTCVQFFLELEMFYTEGTHKIKTHTWSSRKITQGLEWTTDPNKITVLTFAMVLTWVPLHVQKYYTSI